MILKKKEKLKKKTFQNIFYKYYFYSTSIIAIIFLIIFFNSGFWQMNKDKINDRLEIYGYKNYKYLPRILYSSITGFFNEPDKIYLDLSYKQIIKLEKNRSDKIANQEGFFFPYDNGTGFPFDFKWSNGSININDDKKEKIRIRLKGARSIHWEDEVSSSYRVKVKSDGKIYGADTFSLQKPRSRNYLHEWIFHHLCKEMGLVSINYKFIDLIKNGEDKGLYVFEESFSNELIERNKRRDGPIFSLDEKISTNFKKTEIEVYDKKKWKDLSITRIAAIKLKNFFKRKENSIENIDIDLWAKYFAIIDLTQTFHGLLAKSVKFFYNPVSGLIEPIGFDGHYFPLSKFDGSKAFNKGSYFDLLIEMSNKNDNYTKEFINLFLSNEEFKKKYFLYLNNITEKSFLDKFFLKYKKQINENLSLIYSDYFFNDHGFFYGPGIYYFNKEDYYKRANLIKRKIRVYQDKINVSLNNGILNIKNYNLNKFIKPISVKCLNDDISIENKNFYSDSSFNLYFKEINKNCEEVIFEGYPSKKKVKVDIDFYSNHKLQFITLKEYASNLEKYFDFDKNNIYFKEQITVIDNHIFIPKKYTINLKPDQEIILKNGAFIFSKANWIFKNKERKVKIYSEGDDKGGGIFIFNNQKQTVLNNIEYYNLGTQNRDYIKSANTSNLLSNFNLLGSLNFYKTSVKISNSSFFDISSEDAINIIDSNFLLDNNKFHNIKFDAIDFDFTSGSISNLNFTNIGNDALDFSGSSVKIKNIFGDSVSDKFVSVGENSNLNINNVKLVNSSIGIASKDGSNVLANKLSFDQVTYPFASYKKKNEYGGGILKIKNFKISNFKKTYLKDDFSIVELDKELQKKITKNILKLIY